MQITHVRKGTHPTVVRFLTSPTDGSLPDFNGDIDVITVRYTGATSIVYCGIGAAHECTVAALRTAAAKASQMLQKLKRTQTAVEIPLLPLDPALVEKTVIEGILLGAYRFTKYRQDVSASLQSIEIVGGTLRARELGTVRHQCQAVTYARDLINDNASEITPQRLAVEAKKIAASKNMSVTILDRQMLERNKLGLITAVGSASTTPPVLIMLEYRGDPRSKKRTAIIGKGVTFDSGGQNLKPTGSIESMRHDMAGAASVLTVFSALGNIQPKINLIGIIPAVHNAIGSSAYFPGDIYRSHSGKTVEIWSTDAEGRLILADAISYCREYYSPDTIIDLATLTGGIVSALGDLVAGLFSNDDALATSLFAAGEATGERLWRFPLYKEYSDSLKGDLGDLRNTSKFKKGSASSIIGAAFLKEFVGDVSWAHLDIAGTAWNEGTGKGEIPQYATGFGVRLLLSYLGL